MILAIDVGNTNITVGCLVGGEVQRVFRLSTDTSKTTDEYASEINTILQFHSLERTAITGGILSCVVPPLTAVLKNAVTLLAGVEAIVVGAGVKTGLNILIDDPAQLGGDMVATAVGALDRYKAPMIIVDMGTATKMYVLNRTGAFIGGAILPGTRLSMNALAAGTSQLPRVPIEAPAKCISANTIDCMKSGAVYGTASMIDGMTERFETELGERANIIVTGGQAISIHQHCKRKMTHDPDLILRGLGVIYGKNVKAAGGPQVVSG